jgi:hypothetical protein
LYVDVAHWMMLSRSDGMLVAMLGGAGFALLLNRASDWWGPYADRLATWLDEIRRR